VVGSAVGLLDSYRRRLVVAGARRRLVVDSAVGLVGLPLLDS